jgi:hypothetical protein
MEVEMKTIEVSTDVFARIWALREQGEQTEDAVLQRVLSHFGQPPIAHPGAELGHVDPRFGVSFEPGFEVFRTYHGARYRARAEGGGWRLTGSPQLCNTLNELSRAIGAKTENAWQNWFFQSGEGPRPVSELRNPELVVRKNRGRSPRHPEEVKGHGERWVDDVVKALQDLGGKATLSSVYDAVERIRRDSRRSIPRTLDATVRRTLEDHSSDSHNYQGRADLFFMPEGKGSGVWALRRA